MIAFLPIYLAWKQPGGLATRHTIAVAQMLFSALLIDLTGGRIETHFHIFGSLAFLAFYRDPKVLISATVVVALDHMIRGIFWPQSVFGILTSSDWRWVEHAGWVVFENTFLLLSIRQSLNEMHAVAERQAALENINTNIERQVIARTAELTAEIGERERVEQALRESQGLYHSLVEELPISVYRKNAVGDFVFANSNFCKVRGLTLEQILGKTAAAPTAEDVADARNNQHEKIMRTGQSIELEESFPNLSGGTNYFHAIKLPVRDATGQIVGSQGIHIDITERKQAEQQLGLLHKQLVDASRQAGMAEVATSVLHNVGNVLNSVNVSGSLISERMRSSKVSNVSRIADLLQKQENDLGNFFTNDPNGKKLPNYITQLASALNEERDLILREVDSLSGNISHIKEIVTMQQTYAKSAGVIETLKVTDLVEDAIRMNAGAMNRHQVKIVCEFAEVPAIPTDRHKILQILVNVLRNAKYACDDSGRSDKQITVRIHHGEGHVVISVADNGIGIPPENLTRIFNHGFTTRKDGHGFGLHSGALSAKELGGSLVVSSEGTGKGATFTLDLPLNQ
ncbi:MAG TPA: ATP-binding protein [Verrucomicrobiae bacterium]|nr:ATP-binding protein [Verrucomicrobiae bacterium]